MARKRDDSNPIEARRRQLEEQEKLVAQKRREIRDQIESGSAGARVGEPPIWRREDEEHHDAAPEPTPARRRHLAHQRRRDMILFFAFIAVLLIVVVAVLWLMHVHSSGTGRA